MLISEQIKSLTLAVLKLCLSEGSSKCKSVNQSVEKSTKYEIFKFS